MLGGETTLLDAFRRRNEVLQGAVQGIAELITRPGLINVDFADVRTVMAEMGMAMMGSERLSTGEDRAREAAEAAVSSPLLEDINLAGANGILVNVTAGMDLSIGEFQEVGNTIKEFASDDATVVVGTVIDPDMTIGSASPSSRPGWARRRDTVPSRRCAWFVDRPEDSRTSRTTMDARQADGAAQARRGRWSRARPACRKSCWTYRHSCAARQTT